MDRPVPCGTCTACCYHYDVVIKVALGEDASQYDTVAVPVPVELAGALGRTARVLRHNEDGSCTYLKAGKCSIYHRRPLVCREFDCRRFYHSMTRPERRRHLRSSQAAATVFAAARNLELKRTGVEEFPTAGGGEHGGG